MKKLMLSAVLSVASIVPVAADDWGTVTGQVIVSGTVPAAELLHRKGAEIKDKEVCAAEDVYKDDLVINAENKGLANVFVYLAKAPKTIHPDLKAPAKQAVIFDQKNCRFIPHALIVRTGQTVEIISSDPIAHNAHTFSFSARNPPFNVIISPNTQQGKGYKTEIKGAEKLPFKVVCDFHTWMAAYWLAVDHPYAAVTDEDGKFTIAGLPVGEHEFRVWHETGGYISRNYVVKVEAGDNPQTPIEVSADVLKERLLKR